MGSSDYLVSKQGIWSWHRDDGNTASAVLIPDIVGGHNLGKVLTGTSPTIQTNALNGKTGWHWDGTMVPLSNSTATTLKHIFLVASFDESTFTTLRGLVSGLDISHPILVTNSTGTTFFDVNSLGLVNFVLRTWDVPYSASVFKAPVGGVPAVIELIFNSGYALDGLQVGQDRADTTRRHKGYFYEMLTYTNVLGDAERMRIYQYFAKTYRLWEKAVDAGPWVFPFTSDWGSSDPRKKIVLYDEAEDGSPVYRTKRPKKRYSSFGFTSRTQDELDASEAFYDQHHPGTQFVYRDRTVTPYKAVTYRFAPDANVDDVIPVGPNRFNYKLNMNEVVEVVSLVAGPDTTPPTVPTGLEVTFGEGTIDASWDASTD